MRRKNNPRGRKRIMNWELFVHGCIGAVAPEVVRLYKRRLVTRKMKFSRFYLIISLVYVILGGYIASIFPGISEPFWGACIGSSTVLNVNMMVKISTSLFARLTDRPSFEDGYKKASRLGSKPAPARSSRERAKARGKSVLKETKEEGTFRDYTELL